MAKYSTKISKLEGIEQLYEELDRFGDLEKKMLISNIENSNIALLKNPSRRDVGIKDIAYSSANKSFNITLDGPKVYGIRVPKESNIKIAYATRDDIKLAIPTIKRKKRVQLCFKYTGKRVLKPKKKSRSRPRSRTPSYGRVNPLMGIYGSPFGMGAYRQLPPIDSYFR